MAEDAFLSLMPETVVVRARTGHNNYGEATYAAAGSTWRCRRVGRSGAIRGRDGEVYEIRSVMWIASTGVINKTDRFTLTDGTSPEIVAVDRYSDQFGTHHYKVTLGH